MARMPKRVLEQLDRSKKVDEKPAHPPLAAACMQLLRAANGIRRA